MQTGQRMWLGLIGAGVLSLVAGMWGGLIRMGWPWPVVDTVTVTAHGALMVSGFLGTVIGLERAVALRVGWVYLGPLLSGLATIALLAGVSLAVPVLGLALAAALLAATLALIVRRHPALYTVTMLVGGLAWLVGNVLWLAGYPIYRVVPFWMAFLVLTVAGERLELARFTRPSPLRRETFVASVAVVLIGVLASVWLFDASIRLAGLGLLLLAAWLLRYDIALQTVRRTGATRYIAVALLGGYIWLGIGGALELWAGGVAAGYLYDAALHAVFVGFIMSMIFGHALIIVPALTRRALPYRPVFYAPLALLSVSLLIRIVGDLAGDSAWRMAGGLLNATAIVLFMALLAYNVLAPAPAALTRGQVTPKGHAAQRDAASQSRQ